MILYLDLITVSNCVNKYRLNDKPYVLIVACKKPYSVKILRYFFIFVIFIELTAV